ncbi:MAG: hypothetical protein JRJ58_12485 [Deltaproteobacteria bacterium]|nr:hypothetical protein [Deltaproteobacteria bacterium]
MSSSSHAFGLALLLLFSTAGCAGLAPQAPSPVDADVPSAASPFESLASVQSFRALQASIEEMSEVILADAKSEREVSQVMRFLLRTLAMAIDVQADGNPRAPHFARMDTQVRKVGGDNPDAEYDLVVLDNRRDYGIHGNVGSVRHLSFTVMGGRERGRARTIGYFNERTLDPDEQGRFTLYLTRGDPGDAQHVDTTHGVSSILVRQYIGDRGREELASYEIEVLDPERGAAVPYVTDAEIARAILGTRWAFTSLSTLHRTVMPELLDHPNRFVAANSDDFGADISGSDNLYMLGSYQVDEDEALIIETDPLDVSYWNLAVESRWHESVDYMSRRTHRTLEDVVVDPDGKLRFVLAHGRTPHPNWLDTGGNREGFLTFRWVGRRDVRATLPVIRRVERSELESILGATIAESQVR